MSISKTPKTRLYAFVAAYISVFTVLAVIGYYLADEVGLVHRHQALQTQKFATDLAYYDLPRMNIGLNDDRGATHIRIDLSLEVAKKDMPVIQGYEPRITDRLGTFLSTVTPEHIKQVQYLPWLHQQMLKQINAAGSPAPVHDVLLRQMVIM